MSIRHDWYQSDTKVVITVLLKNAAEKNCAVQIDRQRVHMTADDYELDVKLCQPIKVEGSSYKEYPSKVEIILLKEAGDRWNSLEGTALPPPTAAPPVLHKKDWDSVVKTAERTEEEDPPSEEALNKLFRAIYSSSSPEVQKAMNKSFQESAGTVLSTNWNQVSQDKVAISPPEGAEFRKWQ